MNNFFSKKRILVAGGTGLVGQQLVDKLLRYGAKIIVASLDKKELVNPKVNKFYRVDLNNPENCKLVTKKVDIVFNVLGATGSPMVNNRYPGTFMVSNLLSNLNLLIAAKNSKVKNYLYTSTYGVYSPAKIMREKDVWKTFPSEHDKFAGWAKRIGELQIEAFNKEFSFESMHVVRPANIYGPYGNFNPKSSMVISSLVKKFADKQNPIIVWGDGTAKRDFVYSGDVADSMIKIMEKKYEEPINIGSGKGTSIKKLVELLKEIFPGKKPKVIFDKSKPTGDKIRILDVTNLNKLGIKCNTNIKQGLKDTFEWYLRNKSLTKKRFNFFKNKN